MKFIPDRLVWSLWRRNRLRATLPYFWASPLSYCCPQTVFAGYHTIKSRTEIYASRIGRFTYFAENVRAKQCEVGPLCSIGPDVILGDLPRHPTDLISTHPLFYSRSPVAGIAFAETSLFQEYAETRVGGDVFIGARALVLPGIKLGHGCIVGAGAIVTKDVPDYAIVVGAPAKVKRYRFATEVITQLVGLNWWFWTPEKLKLWQAAFAKNREVSLKSIEIALRAVEKQ